MVSQDSGPAVSKAPDVAAGASGARVPFSSDFFDEKNFITISPGSHHHRREDKVIELARGRNGEFEFLSGNSSSARHTPAAAGELFREGKLLPSWQKQQSQKLGAISLKAKAVGEEVVLEGEVSKGESRVSWYVDDDPSPRPPKCTVLWKELLRLKKQRASSFTPPSPSSTSSSLKSLGKMASIDEEKEVGEGKKEKHIRRIKKGLERTRSASIRIRPMVSVPACTQGRGSGLPPLFSLRKEVREVRR